MKYYEKEDLIKFSMTILITCMLAIIIWKTYELKYDTTELSINSSEKSWTNGSIKSEEEIVPLKMYIIGDKPTDFDMVLEEVNKKFSKLIGIQLTVDFISNKDLGIDYHTIFAGGADFDLIQTYPYNYNVFTSKYAYMNLTEDMLRKCAPQLNIEQLDSLRVNQMVHAVPSQAHLENSIVLLIRGDIAKAYGIENINSIDELERYMGLIKNNEENIMPLNIGSNGLKLIKFLCTQPNHIRLYDDFWIGIKETDRKNPVLWLPETYYFKEYLKRIKNWKILGYIPEEASSKRIVAKDNFVEGSSAVAIGEIFEMENLKREVEYLHPEYEPKIVTIGNGALSYFSEPIHHGIAIKNGSQYAAKSLMLIELLRTDREIFRLMNYGIEGIHYYEAEDGWYEPLAESINYPIYNNPVWCMTDEYRLKYHFSIKNIIAYDQIVDPDLKMKASSMSLKVLDLTNLEATQKNYGYPLSLGIYDDYSINQAINSYLVQMEDVGFYSYYNQVKSLIEDSK